MSALLLPVPGPRKEAILTLTPKGGLHAEIGADHGITSAYLLHRGIADKLIVSDISAASLDKAKRLFARHGLTERAAFRVADGLDALAEAVDAVLISGMGAVTMTRILSRGLERLQGAALVLQPNPDPPALREWLAKNGYRIAGEALAYESGRFYITMLATPGVCVYTPRELLLGPCLLRSRPEGWGAYLRLRRDCLLAVHGMDTRDKLQWIEEALENEASQGT